MSHFLSHTAASVSWIILNPISTNFSSKLISLRRMRWTPPCHDSVWFNNDRVGWNFCSDASYIPTKSSSSSVWYKLYTFKLTYLLYKKISEKPSGFPRGPSQLVFLTAWQTSWRRDSVLWHFVTSVMLSGHQCPYWHVPVNRQSQHATQERISNAIRRLGNFS